MFFAPFCCAPGTSPSRTDHLKFKLDMLKAVRDHLETRLAATNAAIETTERQISDQEGATAT